MSDVIDFVVRWRLVVTVKLKDNWLWLDVLYKRLGHGHRHLQPSRQKYDFLSDYKMCIYIPIL